MPKYSKSTWRRSMCFFCLVFGRWPFNVPEKPWRCSSVFLYFILSSKIICCDHPPVKEETMWFLILFGQWGTTWQVTNILFHYWTQYFAFLYFLLSQSGVYVWSRTQQKEGASNDLLDRTLILFVLIFSALIFGTQKPQTQALKLE